MAVGGPFRKLLYGSLGLSTGTAICYPNEAWDAASQSATVVKTKAEDLWSSLSGK